MLQLAGARSSLEARQRQQSRAVKASHRDVVKGSHAPSSKLFAHQSFPLPSCCVRYERALIVRRCTCKYVHSPERSLATSGGCKQRPGSGATYPRGLLL